MEKSPDMLAWFIKPEEAMKRKLNESIDENL